jgi:mannose-6-phosphate isomerase-like protein (cupin superfamily)
MALKHFLLGAYAFFLCFLSGSVHAETANPAAGKYTIENSVNSFSMDKIEKTEAGYQYWFADKKFLDGRTLKLSVVKPGKATHEPHTHAEDEFFFVLEGQAEFYLDDKTVVVGPYTSLYCPSGSKHGIRNAGDTELKYLVIKKYENVE